MKRYVVTADLRAYGAPPMPVAAFWTLPGAVLHAWIAAWVAGLPFEVSR